MVTFELVFLSVHYTPAPRLMQRFRPNCTTLHTGKAWAVRHCICKMGEMPEVTLATSYDDLLHSVEIAVDKQLVPSAKYVWNEDVEPCFEDADAARDQRLSPQDDPLLFLQGVPFLDPDQEIGVPAVDAVPTTSAAIQDHETASREEPEGDPFEAFPLRQFLVPLTEPRAEVKKQARGLGPPCQYHSWRNLQTKFGLQPRRGKLRAKPRWKRKAHLAEIEKKKQEKEARAAARKQALAAEVAAQVAVMRASNESAVAEREAAVEIRENRVYERECDATKTYKAAHALMNAVQQALMNDMSIGLIGPAPGA